MISSWSSSGQAWLKARTLGALVQPASIGTPCRQRPVPKISGMGPTSRSPRSRRSRRPISSHPLAHCSGIVRSGQAGSRERARHRAEQVAHAPGSSRPGTRRQRNAPAPVPLAQPMPDADEQPRPRPAPAVAQDSAPTGIRAESSNRQPACRCPPTGTPNRRHARPPGHRSRRSTRPRSSSPLIRLEPPMLADHDRRGSLQSQARARVLTTSPSAGAEAIALDRAPIPAPV